MDEIKHSFPEVLNVSFDTLYSEISSDYGGKQKREVINICNHGFGYYEWENDFSGEIILAGVEKTNGIPVKYEDGKGFNIPDVLIFTGPNSELTIVFSTVNHEIKPSCQEIIDKFGKTDDPSKLSLDLLNGFKSISNKKDSGDFVGNYEEGWIVFEGGKYDWDNSSIEGDIITLNRYQN